MKQTRSTIHSEGRLLRLQLSMSSMSAKERLSLLETQRKVLEIEGPFVCSKYESSGNSVGSSL